MSLELKPIQIGTEVMKHRDRNPSRYLVFVLYASESVRSQTGSIITQECLYLIEASTTIEAYKQALNWASPRQLVPVKDSEPIELPLLGITEVMPIWESLEHGNELGYRDGESETWESLRLAVLQIKDLQPFPGDASPTSP